VHTGKSISVHLEHPEPAGLGTAFADSTTNEGGHWIAKKGENAFEARIVSDERYGIVDFQIIPAPGVLDVFPSRVVANGARYRVRLYSVSNP
jgi:hypothetical protein